MQMDLSVKPKSPVVIEGFPGFGLVGTIATEFLIEHLKAKSIGKIWSDKLLPLVAIHDSKVIQPLEIYYAEKENIVILHALSSVNGLEWKISEVLVELAKELKVKEIISIEGVSASEQGGNLNTFYYTTAKKGNAFEKIGLKPLKEGIVMGVTGALMLKAEELPLSCIFVEVQSNLPDSRAAAKIIEALDKYLDLDVDYKPLIKAAEQFEEKIKGIMQNSKEAVSEKESKELNYLG